MWEALKVGVLIPTKEGQNRVKDIPFVLKGYFPPNSLKYLFLYFPVVLSYI